MDNEPLGHGVDTMILNLMLSESDYGRVTEVWRHRDGDSPGGTGGLLVRPSVTVTATVTVTGGHGRPVAARRVASGCQDSDSEPRPWDHNRMITHGPGISGNCPG